jgi:hypothetical protein
MSLADARNADAFFAKHADQLRPDLVPFLTLPRAEHPRVTRARMAQFLQHRFAFAQQITREDIEAAGFTPAEIDRHFNEAKRIARLPAMVS